MAEKRMFSKKVIDSDSFIELPSTSQALYLHLSQGADDEGFNNQVQMAMFKAHASIDDLKVLIMKNFVIKFETGVIVIKHWKLNNYLQNDRTKPTLFQKEKSLLKCDEKTHVYNLDTTCIHSIDENRLDKIRLDKNSSCSIDNTLKLVDEPKISTTTTTKDNEEDSLLTFTEKIFGRPLGGTEIEIISTWEDNQVTRYAIKQAELARAFNVRYIERILSAYKKDNIKNVAEAEERERKFQESKTTKNIRETKVPEWLDKKIEKEEVSEEERQELENMFKEFR